MMMETVPTGTVLHGRYRIERVLGSGGFGHVYLALDLKTNQQFAIKEYFVTGSSGQAQLQHEAKVLSQLHHPNLPAFQEAFNERGHYFVVLSYIEGNDLTDLIRVARQRNEPIPLPKVLGWILSVCDAVQFLHTQQPVVIHRDIKPDNIRIMPNGTAILVDLGNAKATADGARTLFFIRHQGTPGYAPQEQYPGGTGTDVRSDVYALGGTLYFALTAHEPPSVSTRNQSIQQGLPDLPSLQEQLANNPPVETLDVNAGRQFRLGVTKPSKPAPRHLRHLAQLGKLPPELLDQLNRIIKRAMAMKQRDRYPSVEEFSRDLRKVIEALPALSAPPAAPRGVDPNSTQPDLPQLYEAIETAKGQSNLPPASTTTHPQAQPEPPAAAPLICPRCGAPIVQQASYCPSCGSSLNSLFKAKATPADATNVINKAKAQNKAPARDISLESTQVIKPQAQTQTSTQVEPKPESHPSASPPTVSSMSSAPAKMQVQMKPTSANTPQMPAQPPTTTPSHSPAITGGPQFQSRLLILLAIFLVILIVILLLAIFLLSRMHSPSAFHNPGPWSFGVIQVVFDERNFSFGIASSFAPTALRLWACLSNAGATIGLA